MACSPHGIYALLASEFIFTLLDQLFVHDFNCIINFKRHEIHPFIQILRVSTYNVLYRFAYEFVAMH